MPVGDPLRILFLTQTYPRFDGDTSGPFIRDLACGLVRGGDEVKVLTPHAPEVAAEWDDDGVEVESFRYAPESWEVLGYSRSLERDESPRPGALAVTPLYLRAARNALKREVRDGGYDLVQAHWVVPNGLLLPTVSAEVATAVGLHGSDVFMAEKPGLSAWTRRVLRSVDVLTGCSPELVDRVGAVGFPAERSRVIPYGVDVNQFHPGGDGGDVEASRWRDQLAIPAAATVLLSVGRMVSKKGYQHLVPVLADLLAAAPELHVVFAGGGDLLDELRGGAAEYVDRVHFPGVVYRDRLPALYRAADYFVLPAVHDAKGNVDGLPNVILEAMASGLAVVASSISGIPLAVEDGVNGRLVPEADPRVLIDALTELALDSDRRRAMGSASRARATENHTWATIAGRYREAYTLAVERHRVVSASSDAE